VVGLAGVAGGGADSLRNTRIASHIYKITFRSAR
jgi:hypothetical protein